MLISVSRTLFSFPPGAWMAIKTRRRDVTDDAFDLNYCRDVAAAAAAALISPLCCHHGLNFYPRDSWCY